jgi:putative DNA primase/helicase
MSPSDRVDDPVALTAARIAGELGGAKREGAGWRCRCPAHDDHDPSLGITERDGKILFKCRAGCEQAAVIEPLRRRHLWPESGAKESRIVSAYSYRDETGALRYQVVRLRDPKDFRQRRPNGAPDTFEWNMHGVEPLPYRLPDLLADPDATVFLPEGEKDVDNLADVGDPRYHQPRRRR